MMNLSKMFPLTLEYTSRKGYHKPIDKQETPNKSKKH